MSKKKQDKVELEYDFKQITRLILKDKGIQKGHFLAFVVPDILGGQIKSKDENNIKQGLILEFNTIKLVEVEPDTENAVDASKL